MARKQTHPNMTDFMLINKTEIFPTAATSGSQKKLTICVGGFFEKDKQFLFGLRSLNKNWAPGVWDVVGGKAKKGENPTDSLEREVSEETGVRAINPIFLMAADVYSSSSQQVLFKYYLYMITSFTGQIANTSQEHSELRWFTRADMAHLPLALNEYLSIVDRWLFNNYE